MLLTRVEFKFFISNSDLCQSQGCGYIPIETKTMRVHDHLNYYILYMLFGIHYMYVYVVKVGSIINGQFGELMLKYGALLYMLLYINMCAINSGLV